jgi:hypothetical protein
MSAMVGALAHEEIIIIRRQKSKQTENFLFIAKRN